MKIWTRLRKWCVLSIVVAFVATNVTAQTLVGLNEAPDAGQPGDIEENRDDASAIRLAAAIGIVKPKAEAKPEVAAPVEPPPALGTPQPVVEAPVVEETPQTASKGVSKLAIGAGVGLAAILAAVAGGGGGGSSSTPSHTPTP